MKTATAQTTEPITLANNPLYEAWKAKGLVHTRGWGWGRPMIEPGGDMHAEVMAIGRDGIDRTHLCDLYSFAVPTQGVVRKLARMFPRIVEVGAGRGYWAAMLADAGADVVAYDKSIRRGRIVRNGYHKKQVKPATYHPVQYGTAASAAEHADRDLLLCWAPYDDPMAESALLNYRGSDLIWIGEDDGGCCGGEGFWNVLKEGWEETAMLDIPQWPRIRDYVAIYHRK